MDTASEMLSRQIETEIQDLAVEEDGDKKRTKIAGLKDLYSMKLDEEETRCMSQTRKVDCVVNAIQGIGGIVLAAGFTIAGFQFEKTGTLLSPTFRNWWSKFPMIRR